MALTDTQWAQTVADIVARLVDGSTNEVQAAAELAAATNDWPTRTLSNADLAARVSRFLARLNGLILTSGAPSLAMGELNTFAYDTTNGALYGPKTAEGWGTPVSLVGPPGASGTITSITVATGAAGSQASIVLGGTPSARTLALTLPRGDLGNPGPTPVLSIGTVTTGAAGSAAAATFGGTAGAPILNLTIPRGNAGLDATITSATAATGAPGSAVSIAVGGTAGARTFAFTIPRGDVGATPALSIGTVTTGAAGSAAAVTIGGTAAAPVLNFTIPRGNTGATPALSIGTVTTGAPASSAIVTITGTPEAPIINLTIPRGDPGASGSGTGDVLGPATHSDGRVPLWFGTNSKTLGAGLPIGVGTATSLLDRNSGDARYRPIAYVPAFGDLTAKPVTLAGYGIADAYTKTQVDTALGGKQASLGFTPENVANKGQASGYASLGSDGKVPAAQLPTTSATFSAAEAAAYLPGA